MSKPVPNNIFANQFHPLDFETARNLYRASRLRLWVDAETARELSKNPVFGLGHRLPLPVTKVYFISLAAVFFFTLIGAKVFFVLALFPTLISFYVARFSRVRLLGEAAMNNEALYNRIVASDQWLYKEVAPEEEVVKPGPLSAGSGEETIGQRFWANMNQKAQNQEYEKLIKASTITPKAPFVTVAKKRFDYRTARRLRTIKHLSLGLTDKALEDTFSFPRVEPEKSFFNLENPIVALLLLFCMFLWAMGLFSGLTSDGASMITTPVIFFLITLFLAMKRDLKVGLLIRAALRDEKLYNELLDRGGWIFKSDLRPEELDLLIGQAPEAEHVEIKEEDKIENPAAISEESESEKKQPAAEAAEPIEEEAEDFMSMFLELEGLVNGPAEAFEIISLKMNGPAPDQETKEERPAAPWSRPSSAQPETPAAELSFSKKADPASPALLEALWSGRIFPRALIRLRQNGEDGWGARLSLETVKISGYEVTTIHGTQLEKIVLEYRKADFEADSQPDVLNLGPALADDDFDAETPAGGSPVGGGRD